MFIAFYEETKLKYRSDYKITPVLLFCRGINLFTSETVPVLPGPVGQAVLDERPATDQGSPGESPAAAVL